MFVMEILVQPTILYGLEVLWGPISININIIEIKFIYEIYTLELGISFLPGLLNLDMNVNNYK